MSTRKKDRNVASSPSPEPGTDVPSAAGPDPATGRDASPEALLRKLNRTYAVLSEINQTIVRERNAQRLFAAACRIAVEIGGFRMAWIGKPDAETRRILPVAHAGEVDGYLDQVDLRLDDVERGRGPTVTALRAGDHVVVDDIATDPRMTPWRTAALRLGFRASAAFPLVVAGEVRGVLSLYADEPGFFDAGELRLLDEMAKDIAFALEFIDEDEQRRRVERDLRESEQRYQILAAISPVGIFRTDPRGATTYVNPKWCEISGLSFAAALGDGWLAAVHPDDREPLGRDWHEATSRHATSVSEYRFVRPDGTIAWVMGQAVPELDASGELVGYVGTVTDITERQRTEAELADRERQLATIYHSISDVLFYVAVEPEGRFRFLSVNPAFLAATGLTADQVVGKPVTEVIPEPAHELVLGNYRRAVDTRKTVGWQEVSVYPAGTKYGEVSATPIFDAEGRCTHLIGAVHDVTDRVRAQEELQRLNAELEARVARRTDQLAAALEQAQEADRMKSAFLATMSHELRTPLNSILGFAGVLLQGLAGPLNAEQTKQLGMTRDSARHLLALINDVLDISKIEARQLTVARAPFDLRDAIESALRAVAAPAEKKGLTVTAAIPANVGVVVSDRRRVEQILLNLLSNAVKFTDRGEIQLACRPHAGWLEISVRDTGIGIRAADLTKLFEPFQQLETGLDRRHEGTGLGLAICKNLVELLGGTIRAESEWGVGSTFTFTLPLAA